MVQRKRHTAEFKAKVALAALKGQQTLNELASLYGVHPVQVAQWKKQATVGLPEVFASRRAAMRAGDGSAAGAVVPGDRAAQGRTGLAQKENWAGLLRRSGR